MAGMADDFARRGNRPPPCGLGPLRRSGAYPAPSGGLENHAQRMTVSCFYVSVFLLIERMGQVYGFNGAGLRVLLGQVYGSCHLNILATIGHWCYIYGVPITRMLSQ